MFEPVTVSTEVPSGDFGPILFGHKGRGVHKWLHYCRVYDQLIGPYRGGFVDPSGSVRPLRFLEIGVLFGGSLQVWREYLGPEAVIFGIDIDPACAVDPPIEAEVRIGSQSDPAFLRRVVEEMGGVDIVLDDGAHIASLQHRSFDALFPLLPEGGLYIVEDAHTSYSWSFGGGYRRRGTIIETAKSMVDGMNKWHFRWPVGRRAHLAWRQVAAIHFFESVVAFEKGSRQRPQSGEFGESFVERPADRVAPEQSELS